jgi:hypothetical protein
MFAFSIETAFRPNIPVAHEFRENLSKSSRTYHFFQRVSRDVRDGTRPKHFSPEWPLC